MREVVRESVDGLPRDGTLVAVVLGIALGWALYQVAQGLRTIVSTLLAEYPEPSELFHVTQGTGLTWVVGDRSWRSALSSTA